MERLHVLIDNDRVFLGSKEYLDTIDREKSKNIRPITEQERQKIRNIFIVEPNAKEIFNKTIKQPLYLDIGRNIVNAFLGNFRENKDADICHIINMHTDATRIKGKGQFATVFNLYDLTQGKRDFVVKIEQIPFTSYKIQKSGSIQDIITILKNGKKHGLVKNFDIPEEAYIMFNDPVKKYQVGDEFLIPSFFANCEEINLPHDSGIFCSAFHEIMISLLVSRFVTENKCINFIESKFFALCNNEFRQDTVMASTIMELAGVEFTSELELAWDRPESSPFSLHNYAITFLLGILYAIYLYKLKYRINHDDLHFKNIFADYLTDDEDDYVKMWNGIKIEETDYGSYEIGYHTLFFPMKQAVIYPKIADWGRASKFSEPKLLYKDRSIDYFSENYDVLHVVNQWAYNGLPGYKELASFCYDRDFTGMRNAEIMEFINRVAEENLRPTEWALENYDHVTAENVILKSGLFTEYKTWPNRDIRVINLGTDK